MIIIIILAFDGVSTSGVSTKPGYEIEFPNSQQQEGAMHSGLLESLYKLRVWTTCQNPPLRSTQKRGFLSWFVHVNP